jgi:hypothetical protein
MEIQSSWFQEDLTVLGTSNNAAHDPPGWRAAFLHSQESKLVETETVHVEIRVD